MLVNVLSAIYKHALKPIFFLFNPELVHEIVTSFGELIGGFPGDIFNHKDPILRQKILGINFESPVGLAAGFDYEARLTQVLAPLGFGFQTVGTITKLYYEGNPKPRLGRLPKSKSLMVYKGFKNRGAQWTAEKLEKLSFKIPLGISIGKSNSKLIQAQKTAIEDILQAFTIFELSNIKNTYYELNISCPNLAGVVTFYPPKNLDELLSAVDELKMSKPIFIKMPIDHTNFQTKQMLDVILRHKIAGVIFGNVQTNRKNPTLYKDEVKKFNHGNFSGLPTQKRSDELIALAYNHCRGKLLIIGTGGIFSAQDAYRKIKLGANLVQLITGLIYEGPLLVAKINQELPRLLKRDGFKNISEAVGTA
jgi:dihydroorotate dehydrogenase subfamily 2